MLEKDKDYSFLKTAIEDLVKAHSSDNKDEQKEALRNAIDTMKALPLEEKIDFGEMIRAAKKLKKEREDAKDKK